MAIAKVRSADPVRGHYVTTIHTGRITKLSGKGFGVARLGGLVNAQVEGLAGGGTGGKVMKTAVLPTPARQVELQNAQTSEAEKQRVEEHKRFKAERAETQKKELEEAKKGEEIQKKLLAEAEKAADKPKTPEV